MSLYSVVKKTYRTMVPGRIRSTVYRILPRPVKVLRAGIIRELGKHAKHDELYDEEYYAGFATPGIERSYEVLAQTIVDIWAPIYVVDVGCGTGKLLSALQRRGVAGLGLERSSVALEMCHRSGVDVRLFDLEHDSPPHDLRGDLAVSTEVAEHLPKSCADRFVVLLCAISDKILVTAAPPARAWDQVKWGHDHVNEQPREYWIEKFQCNGYAYDGDTTTGIQEQWKRQGVSPWYPRGVMVFHKEASGCLS